MKKISVVDEVCPTNFNEVPLVHLQKEGVEICQKADVIPAIDDQPLATSSTTQNKHLVSLILLYIKFIS